MTNEEKALACADAFRPLYEMSKDVRTLIDSQDRAQIQFDYGHHSERQLRSWLAFNPKKNQTLRFKILYFLLANRGSYFTPEEIVKNCGGHVASITQTIRDIRRPKIMLGWATDIDCKTINDVTVYGLKGEAV